jgi:hypothetical protein
MPRRYFELNRRTGIPNRWFLGDHRTRYPEDGANLFFGKPCRSKTVTIDPGDDGGRGLAFSITAFNIHVARDSLARQLADLAGDDVQILKASLRGFSGYSCVHCIRTIECVDEARSEFDRYPIDDPYPDRRGQYRGFGKLVIDPDRVPENVHVFRAAGWPITYLVSPAVKKLLSQYDRIAVKFGSVNPSQR